MVKRDDITDILKGYDKKRIAIATLGGHSALDICRGAKKLGLRTVVICQRGRDKTYTKYYKKRGDRGVVDDVIQLDHFNDILKEEVQEELRKMNAILIHSRYFACYCDFDKIESSLKVPIFGNRSLIRYEERNGKYNQTELLKGAGVRVQKQFKYPKDIDRMAIVRVHEAQRGFERAHFYANCFEDYLHKSEQLIEKGVVTKEAMSEAVISENLVGIMVTLSYFYSPMTKELEILGMDARRQTNVDGLIRLPAYDQLEALRYMRPKFIEASHIPCTIKESLLDKVFEIGEQTVEASKKASAPGILGPFGLKVCITAGPPKEELVVHDVAFRSPGSPGTIFTPHTSYLYGEPISMGERIAMEVKQAIDENKLDDICT